MLLWFFDRASDPGVSEAIFLLLAQASDWTRLWLRLPVLPAAPDARRRGSACLREALREPRLGKLS
jgi:hypothetical protein